MKKFVFLLSLVALVGIGLPGCGGGGSGSDAPPSQALQDLINTSSPPPVPITPTDPADIPGDPANISLASSVPANAKVSQGGQALITAVVRDGSTPAKLVADGTEVTFAATDGSISTSVLTANGVANATFQAGSAGGTVTITATAGSVQKTISISVASGAAASILTESVTPNTIGILGSGIEDTAQIKFSVRDALGRVAEDGTIVTFSIQTPLNGTEKLSADSATSAGGSVSVALKSGTVPGTVPVVASITTGSGEISTTVAKVTIVSNRPDAGRINIAASTLNLAGGVTLGLQSTISAYLGDRAGNVVPDGTPVSFITECGTIGQSTGFETTTTFGVASGVLQTSSPTVPNLRGIGGFGNPGLCRVVAFTPGKGTFLDLNGNGIFDGSDICNTLPMDEPYIDGNDNGQYDVGEYYVDVNQNGAFDTNVVNCVNDSMIWTSANVLISGPVAAPILAPTTFSIPIGGSEEFTVNFEDFVGNALVAGTTFEVTTTAGTLAGPTSLTQGDTTGSGAIYTFSLLADTAPTSEVKNTEIKVTIGSAPGPNNNGATVFAFANGQINTPPPAVAPTVVFTVPSNGQLNVSLDAVIAVVFSEPMNDLSVNNSSILLENITDGGFVNLPAPTKVGNTGYTFTPTAPLLSGKLYRVTVTNQVFDSQNTQMENPFIFTFTTR